MEQELFAVSATYSEHRAQDVVENRFADRDFTRVVNLYKRRKGPDLNPYGPNLTTRVFGCRFEGAYCLLSGGGVAGTLRRPNGQRPNRMDSLNTQRPHVLLEPAWQGGIEETFNFDTGCGY